MSERKRRGVRYIRNRDFHDTRLADGSIGKQLAVQSSGRRAVPIVNAQLKLVPPRLELALPRFKLNIQFAWTTSAADCLAQIAVVFEGHAVAIVPIQGAVAVLARIHIESQRTGRRFGS